MKKAGRGEKEGKDRNPPLGCAENIEEGRQNVEYWR